MEKNPNRRKTFPSQPEINSKKRKIQCTKTTGNEGTKQNILRYVVNIKLPPPISCSEQQSSMKLHHSSSLPAGHMEQTRKTNNKNKNKYSCGKYDIRLSQVNFGASVSGEKFRSQKSPSSGRELLQQLLEKITDVEKQNQIIIQHVRENKKLLDGLSKKKKVTVAQKPAVLPFQTLDELLQFNNSTNEDNKDLVNFLTYLGGINPTDSAAKYLRHASPLTTICWPT